MEWESFLSSIGHLSATSLARIRKAYDLAKKVHEGQTRKSGEPYFMHPVAVAAKLSKVGADEDTIIAALLHDTVEDTPLTLEEIEKEFGGTVTKLIDGVTKLSASDVAGPNLNEQTETLRKIFRLMQEDSRIMIIKLYDRLHNMETIQFLSPEKAKILAKETYDVYAKIAHRLCMEDYRYELEEHCLRVLKPEILERLQTLKEKTIFQGKMLAKNMERKLQETSAEVFAGVSMELEQKSWQKLEAQLDLQSGAVSGLAPVTIAFICKDRDACYRMLGALHTPWQREVLSFRDFVNTPELNGYRGLHTTVILEDGTRVRCKIRTGEMHEYAHKGAILYSFDKRKKHMIEELLPWTQRIESISSDTEHKSEEFWEGLQSDILGETITIYGPDDKSFQVPKNGTVLDGVFFLFGENAQRVSAIFVNGKQVAFSTPLHNAISLSAKLEENPVLQREWLNWVQTSYATAKIRMALAERDDKERALVGKEMLQKLLTEKKKGFLEEYQENILSEGSRKLGYETLKELYVALADGKVGLVETFETLFAQRRIMPRSRNAASLVVKYDMPSHDAGILDRIQRLHSRYFDQTLEVFVIRGEETSQVTIRMMANRENANMFMEEVRHAGCTNVRLQQSFRWDIVLILLIICVWGLDPVVARILITNGLTPMDLTFIRFGTFFAAAVPFFFLQQAVLGANLKSIAPFKASLISSSAALFLTAALSYVTLSMIPASQYILFIIAGLSLSRIVSSFFQKRLKFTMVLSLILLVSAILLLMTQQSAGVFSSLTAFGSAMGFALYSQASARYQKTGERIHARYIAFLFWLSVFCLPFALLIYPLTQVSTLSWHLVLSAIGFVLVFSILPYGLYYEAMRRANTKVLDSLLPFVCISTLIGEVLFSWSFSGLLALPILALFLWLHVKERMESTTLS